MNNKASYFHKLKSRYLAYRLAEVVLWGLSAAAFIYALSSIFNITSGFGIIASILALVIVSALGFLRYGLHNLSEKRLVKYVNTNYPELEESVDLLLKEDAQLNSLQLLQREKTIERFEKIFPTIQLPQQLGRAAFIFAISIAVSFALISFAPQEIAKSKPFRPNDSTKTDQVAVIPVEIRSLSVKLTPPSYTGLKTQTTSAPELLVPEGTIASWTILFSNEVESAKLVFSGKDSITLTHSGKEFLAKRSIVESGFYQILWKNKDTGTRTSDFYKIEVTYDRSPDIKFENLKQSTELTIADKQTVQITASIVDDYQITDSYIIATVAKGSGESVKFREEKLLFTSPKKISGKNISASRVLDLKQLGLEPGDELYFYAEVFDNHQPVRQHSRTETYFITLQDTARNHLSLEAGLGVDLMPEYFRSQRQIIIDTEKLIASKKKITKHQFNFTSNELGYDQKVLRLKYGEFLGEEFESEVAETEEPELPNAVQPTEEGDDDEDDPTKKFGHAHDEKENLHNLVEDKKGKAGHQHDEEATKDPDKKEDPIAAYKHSHDNMEEATFFTQSIRAKLKAALTIMWDAELQLRLYEPEKSLPYQYQALKLLKEISNDSRIYVHKTGFDPPPLKEEKRLTGDLAELKNSQTTADLLTREAFTNSIKALELADILLARPHGLTKKEIHVFQNAGREISAYAVQEPGKYLLSLSLLKTLVENKGDSAELQFTLTKLRRSLYKIIPEKTITPSQQLQSRHAIDQTFIKTLEAIKND